jgi:hypothetical protein
LSFNYACTSPVIGIHVTDADWEFSPDVEGLLFGVRDPQVGFPGVFIDDGWHHIAAVRDGPANELRIDNQVGGSDSEAPSTAVGGGDIVIHSR